MCYETELTFSPTANKKKLAVIGAGPAGLSFAMYAADRGHDVHLFDQANEIGGQFNYAKQIPGKEEFYETLRYFKHQLTRANVTIHLNTLANTETLKDGNFNEVILATGIKPRSLTIEGHDHPKVLGYLDVLRDHMEVGKRVAVIGAGGIGFDVAEYLVEDADLSENKDKWLNHWGIDKSYTAGGALKEKELTPTTREVFLLQRKTTKVGKGLGKTTGWILRQSLKLHNVQMINGVSYEKIDDKGLHVVINDKPKLLEVDNVIVCAGQEPFTPLKAPLEEAGFTVHIIGGADVAAELDAKRAIRQGAELAAKI